MANLFEWEQSNSVGNVPLNATEEMFLIDRLDRFLGIDKEESNNFPLLAKLSTHIRSLNSIDERSNHSKLKVNPLDFLISLFSPVRCIQG